MDTEQGNEGVDTEQRVNSSDNEDGRAHIDAKEVRCKH